MSSRSYTMKMIRQCDEGACHLCVQQADTRYLVELRSDGAAKRAEVCPACAKKLYAKAEKQPTQPTVERPAAARPVERSPSVRPAERSAAVRPVERPTRQRYDDCPICGQMKPAGSACPNCGASLSVGQEEKRAKKRTGSPYLLRGFVDSMSPPIVSVPYLISAALLVLSVITQFFFIEYSEPLPIGKAMYLILHSLLRAVLIAAVVFMLFRQDAEWIAFTFTGVSVVDTGLIVYNNIRIQYLNLQYLNHGSFSFSDILNAIVNNFLVYGVAVLILSVWLILLAVPRLRKTGFGRIISRFWFVVPLLLAVYYGLLTFSSIQHYFRFFSDLPRYTEQSPLTAAYFISTFISALATGLAKISSPFLLSAFVLQLAHEDDRAPAAAESAAPAEPADWNDSPYEF